jgi:plasmid stabilization system protein ParE
MTFSVRLSGAAIDDVDRLFEHLVDRSLTTEDLVSAERARNAILHALDELRRSPFIYRKAGSSPFLREMLIPFGRSGYVALFEIDGAEAITVLAVRHQLEDDYH